MGGVSGRGLRYCSVLGSRGELTAAFRGVFTCDGCT